MRSSLGFGILWNTVIGPLSFIGQSLWRIKVTTIQKPSNSRLARDCK